MNSFNYSFRLCLIVLATFITTSVFAQNQVRITLHQPPPNQLSAGDLWKMTLENTTGSPLEIYLEGYGEEQSEGRIVDGRSPVFTLPAGRTNYTYENFKAGNVSWKNRKYEDFIVRTGQVPAGSYTTCVTAYSSEGILVGMEKCITQIISRGFEGEITLIAPGDGENIDPSAPITFAWAPLPTGGPYQIKIVEIIGDQSPEVAILRNKAFFEKEDIRITMFQYPSSAPKFVEGKNYVWAVTSGDLQSEFYTFKILPGQSINCKSFVAEEVQNPLGDCCRSINLTHPSNTSNLTGIQFLALTPNSFVTGSSSISSSYNSGWIYPVNTQQEFTIKKISGNFPSGQLNNFFNFCLNNLSSPQQVVVNWLLSDNSVACSDTVNVYCDIPCVTIIEDTLICNENNYNLEFKFTNNASFPINKVEVVSITPSGVSLTTPTITLLSAVNPGQTSNLISNSVVGAIPGEPLCIILKYTSPDTCCWCYDTICVEVPSCVCDEVEATITGDPVNCCFNLSLQNTYSNSYFDKVKVRTLDPGVVFNTWSTNVSNNYYSTNTFADNEINLVFNPPNGYFPISGNPAFVLNYCLTGYTNTTQSIVVEWMRNDSVKCADTLITNCVPPPPVTPCVQILNDTMICLPNGTYQYKFAIKNNSTHTTTGFQFNPSSPSSLVFSPANFSNVTIAPGMVSPEQTMTISGVNPGSEFCFKISLYEHTLITGQQYYDWCCYSETICMTAPTCTTEVPCNFEVLIDSVKCEQNAAGGWSYKVSTRIFNPTGTSAMLHSVLADNGTMNCSPQTLAPGMNLLTCFYNLTGTLSNPTCFTYRILRPGSMDTCIVKVCRDLTPCTTSTGCLEVIRVDSVKCIGKNAAGGFNFSFNIIINNPTTSPIASSTLTSQCGGIITGLPSMFAVGTHQYTATISTPYPGVSQCCLLYQNGSCIDQKCFDLPPECEEPLCLDLVSHTINGCTKLTPSVFVYNISMIITNAGAPVPSSTITSSFGTISGLPSMIPTGSNIPVTFNLTTPGAGVTCIKFSGAVCSDSLCFDLGPCNPPPPPCDCGEWKHKTVSITANGISRKTECGGELEITQSNNVSITFPEYICSPNTCTTNYNWTINGPIVQSGTSNQLTNANFSQPGTYYVTIVPKCGSKDCQPCRITIIVKGDGSSCDCKGWVNDNPNILIRGFNKEGGYEEIEENVQCGKTFSSVNKGRTMGLSSAQYMCSSTENCEVSYKFLITSPSGIVSVSHAQNIDNFLFSEVGIYNIKMTVSCNGKECDNCTIFVRVVDVPTGCQCGDWKGGIRVDGSGIGCNQSFNFLFNKGFRSVQGPTMSCSPNVQNCSPQYSYVVKLNGVTVQTGSGNSFSNFYFQSNKIYTIIFNANCGSIVCQPCQTTIRIKSSIFGGLGNVSFGNIGIKNPNVGPSIFNPSGSVRPDFSWNSSISPGKQGNLILMEVNPGTSRGDLSELVKELQEKEPVFGVSVTSNRASYPKEAPDLSSGKYYIWLVYESSEKDEEVKILDAGFFKAGLTTEGKEIINCDDCEKMCPNGRCWKIGDKCYCF